MQGKRPGSIEKNRLRFRHKTQKCSAVSIPPHPLLPRPADTPLHHPHLLPKPRPGSLRGIFLLPGRGKPPLVPPVRQTRERSIRLIRHPPPSLIPVRTFTPCRSCFFTACKGDNPFHGSLQNQNRRGRSIRPRLFFIMRPSGGGAGQGK